MADKYWVIREINTGWFIKGFNETDKQWELSTHLEGALKFQSYQEASRTKGSMSEGARQFLEVIAREV